MEGKDWAKDASSQRGRAKLEEGRATDTHLHRWLANRIQKLCWGLNTDHVDTIEITKKVIAGVYNGVTTVELDQLAAEVRGRIRHPHSAQVTRGSQGRD